MWLVQDSRQYPGWMRKWKTSPHAGIEFRSPGHVTDSKQLTSWNRILAIFVHLLNKSNNFYWSRRYITLITRAATDTFAQPTVASSQTSIPARSTSTLIISSHLRQIPSDTFPLRPKRYHFSFISHACYMPCSSNPHRFLLSHRTLNSAQTMKLTIFS